MRHEIHYDSHGENIVAAHAVHTEKAAWNTLPNPVNPAQHIDMIDYLRMLIATPELQKGTGWDEPSSHPAYPGQTKIQVFIAEVRRVNDKPALSALGM